MKNIFFLVITILSFSCGSGSTATPEQKQESEKWKAVMANHDVVMPMMGTTNKVRKGLKAVLKKSEGLEATTTTKVNGLIDALNKADDSMMDWMQGYKKLGELQKTKSHEEILQYLDTEESKINKVKELMESSIENGKAFLATMK